MIERRTVFATQSTINSVLAMALFFVSVPLEISGSEWPDPVANHVVPYQTSGLTHGPMLGRPAAMSMRVWVRSEKPMDFEVVYDSRLPLSDECPTVEGKTSADRDNTGFVDLKSLVPNTRYFYGIRTDGYLADTRVDFDEPWPSFRTLPDEKNFSDSRNNPKGLFNFRFSIGCGMRQRTPKKEDNFGIYANPPSFLNLYRNHVDDLAFHIVNGDYTYEEKLDGTRAGYQANYKHYLQRGRNVANFFRYVPVLFTYDDHEANSNLHGSGEVGLGDGNHLRRDDALAVWQQYAGWANDPAEHQGPIRFGRATMKKGSDVLFDPDADFTDLAPEQASTIHVGNYIKGDGRSKTERGGENIGVYGLLKVIDEHRLKVTPRFRADAQGYYSIGTHHYFDKKIANCHFFFLDARGERSEFEIEKAHDPDRFILGEKQREWLIDGLEKTDADFLFIISSVPWTIYHSSYHVRPEKGTGSKGDGFCGYVHERERIMTVLEKIEKPVLIFTGDVHNSIVVQISENVWEFMCGPMNSSGHPIGTAGMPPFGGWFDSEGRKVKIKWVGGYPDDVQYKRLRNTFFTVVSVNNIIRAARSDGIGYQFIAYDEPQVIVQYYDGYNGKLLYAEGISTADAKSKQEVAPKISRWPAGK